MGVSVSYNGSGGRRSFNLDGVPTGDAAKTLGLAPKKHYVPDTLKKMLQMPAPQDPIEEAQKGKVKLNNLDANPGTLSEKVLPGGGVVAAQHGLCLRGEEQTPLVTGVQLFGSVNGSKKYHTIDEIDPKGQPHHVGAMFGDASPEENNEPVVENQPQSYQVAGRVVSEIDDIARLLKLYELDKDVSLTPWGRTVGVTKERRRLICSIINSRESDSYPKPFDIEDGKVVRCEIPAPIAVITCSDYMIDTELGDIYVHVDRGSNGYTLTVDQDDTRAVSSTHAQWILYKYDSGKVKCDCRPRTLPVFDLT